VHLLANVNLLRLAAELGHPCIGPVDDLEDLGAALERMRNVSGEQDQAHAPRLRRSQTQ
jgi:hypothetical protein